MTAADVVALAAFLTLLWWTAWRRAANARVFLVADRAVGLFPLVATLVMTEFNTSTLFAFSAAGYRAGPMALALPLVFLIGLAFYTATVARPWKRFDRLSVAELFAVRYSPGLGRFAAVMLLVAMTGFCATYVKSLELLTRTVLPTVPPALATAVLTVFMTAIVLPGGLLSVVRSDIASFVVTVVLLPALLVMGVLHSDVAGGLRVAFPPDQLLVDPVAQWTHQALPFRFVTTLIVLTCFTYIAAPWYGQKIFAAKDDRTAVAAVAWAAVLVFALYGAAVLAAAHFRVVRPDLADPQLAVPAMIVEWLPAGLRGLGIGVLFAAAMTTLGGVWTAMAAMAAADFGWTGAGQIATQRIVVAAVATASWIGGTYLVDDILNRLILANIPVAALAFALLAGFHWKRATTAGAWASVVVGIVWGGGCFVLVGDEGGYTWPWAMYGLPLIFATGIVVSLLTDAGTRRDIKTDTGR